MTALAHEAARARFTAKVQRIHDGDIWGTIPGARDGQPTVLPTRPLNTSPIVIDGEEW